MASLPSPSLDHKPAFLDAVKRDATSRTPKQYLFRRMCLQIVPEGGPGENITVDLPVLRTQGLFGDVAVGYSVRRTDGSSVDPAADIVPASGTLLFAAADVRQTLTLTVRADAVPELEERFEARPCCLLAAKSSGCFASSCLRKLA